MNPKVANPDDCNILILSFPNLKGLLTASNDRQRNKGLI